MKKILFVSIALAMLVAVASVKADYVQEYGIGNNVNGIYSGLKDSGNGDSAFFQVFNRMFGTAYASMNAIVNKYGEDVDPNSTWYVGEESTLLGVGKNQTGFADVLSITGGTSFGSTTVQKDQVTNLDFIYPLDSKTYQPGSSIDFQLDVSRTDGKYGQINYSLLNGIDAYGNVYMIALDITDLYNEKNDTEFDSVYMFLWEDWKEGQKVQWGGNTPTDAIGSDWDYADFVYIMTNVYTDPDIGGSSTATPEPATLLVLGFGAIGAGFAARRRMFG